MDSFMVSYLIICTENFSTKLNFNRKENFLGSKFTVDPCVFFADDTSVYVQNN